MHILQINLKLIFHIYSLFCHGERSFFKKKKEAEELFLNINKAW